MPLTERLQRLVEGIDAPVAAFDRDGVLIAAGNATRSLLGFRDLAEAGLAEARDEALKQGRAERRVGSGHLVLQRVGSGADVGLIGLIEGGEAADLLPPRSRPTKPAFGRRRMRGRVGVGGGHKLSAWRLPPPPLPARGRGAESSGEAPAEFALVNEFAEEPAEPVAAGPIMKRRRCPAKRRRSLR